MPVVIALVALATQGCKREDATHAPPAIEQHARETQVATAPSPPPSAPSFARVASESEPPAACPAGMVLVEGQHCPVVEHRCLRWLDPPGKWRFFRCAEYAPDATCKAPRVPMRFCIDVDEQGATSTEPRPANHVSFKAAKAACEARGARLCKESEWEFACEGEELRPYAYGSRRDASICNVDREDVVTPSKKAIYDLRRKVGEDAQCTSPFGVRDMAGNLEEWVVRDRHTLHTRTTLLKGSWWLKGRHTCRATNGGHEDWYQGTETGYRCCKDGG